MSGETNLDKLLQSIQPKLMDETFVFCTVPKGKEREIQDLSVSYFREAEADAAILKETDAQAIGLEYEYPSKMITLEVHSGLDAVGFLAAITAVLAKAGISVNPVSAFYHDHLFVPVDRAEDTMKLIKSMGK